MAGFVPYKLPKAPDFKEYNTGEIQKQAVQYDRRAYALSDQDFNKRHSPIVQAENLFQNQVLKDQQGENELLPQLQNEYFRSGLSSALGAFGSTPGTLAPGSAGEANVARNLGLDIMAFQDRNRKNRENSLVTAETIFPRRNFGISGADAANIYTANVDGENNYNQANYANRVSADQSNYNNEIQYNNSLIQQGNANSAASAQKKAGQQSALISGGAAVASAAVLAIAVF